MNRIVCWLSGIRLPTFSGDITEFKTLIAAVTAIHNVVTLLNTKCSSL